jgi:sugar/nucleoside kinase (ribokinase family)
MKILLVGNSIIDHIEEADGYKIKPGGVYYSALGALSVIKENDSVYLLTGWNEDSLEIFNRIYSKVNMSLSVKVENIPEVKLKTAGVSEREEIYINLSARLSIDQIKDWNQFDGILINMITGFDITYEQLQIIRRQYKGLIYFDVHTLSRGVDQNLKREFRPVPDVAKWLSNINILQVNENELRTITSAADETEAAKEILKRGPDILIITKGSKGAVVYFNKQGSVDFYSVDAEKVEVVNKIGCGDIFGAVFFYNYIKDKDVINSLKSANKAGAVAVSDSDYFIKSKAINCD